MVRSRDYAAELVGLGPDLIVAVGTPSVAALKQATRSIPVVFAIVNDPVAQGFVASMAHPGGNLTGFSFLEYSLVGKSTSAAQTESSSSSTSSMAKVNSEAARSAIAIRAVC